MLPDRSVLIGQKLMENAKIENFKCDILTAICLLNSFFRHGKVGTTTWMKHFTNLIPPNRQNVIDWKHLNSPQLHARIPQEFSSKSIEKNLQPGQSLNDYFRQEGYFVFSFVRHPFDRLVSAYLDKIEGKGPMGEKGYRKLRFKLVENYGSVNFESFLKHVQATLRNYEKCIYVGKNEKCDRGIGKVQFYFN